MSLRRCICFLVVAAGVGVNTEGRSWHQSSVVGLSMSAASSPAIVITQLDGTHQMAAPVAPPRTKKLRRRSSVAAIVDSRSTPGLPYVLRDVDTVAQRLSPAEMNQTPVHATRDGPVFTGSVDRRIAQ